MSDALRGRIDELADLDPVTQDLIIGLAATVDKHRWMFSAQVS